MGGLNNQVSAPPVDTAPGGGKMGQSAPSAPTQSQMMPSAATPAFTLPAPFGPVSSAVNGASQSTPASQPASASAQTPSPFALPTNILDAFGSGNYFGFGTGG